MKVSKSIIYNFIHTAGIIIYINLICFLYAFVYLFKGKGSAYQICKMVADFFEPEIFTVKQSQPIRPGKTMFFSNHRSWADFFMDSYLTGGSSYLGRYGVILGVPGPCLTGYLFNFVMFFHRKKGIDRNWFTEFISKKWAVRPFTGCVVYPEGHRFKGEGSLQLKHGVMEVAYNTKTPCQVFLTDGKEELLDEENFKANKHQRLICCVSEVLNPADYATREEWFKAVETTWEKTLKNLEKKENLKKVDGCLPGVDKSRCVEEPILPRHAAWVWGVTIAILLLISAFVLGFCLRNKIGICISIIILVIWVERRGLC